MNLNAAYNAPGNWIVMRGIPTEYNMKTGQFGPYALGKMVDDAGAMADMMFSAGKNAPLPQQSLLNVPCIWAVKYDANTQKTKALFNSYAQNAGPQQPMAQAPPQRPQNAPQATNAPQGARDATGTSIERQTTVKAVCERYAGTSTDLATMLDACHHFHKWIATGEVDFTVLNSPMPTGPANWDADPNDLPPELRDDYQG